MSMLAPAGAFDTEEQIVLNLDGSLSSVDNLATDLVSVINRGRQVMAIKTS